MPSWDIQDTALHCKMLIQSQIEGPKLKKLYKFPSLRIKSFSKIYHNCYTWNIINYRIINQIILIYYFALQPISSKKETCLIITNTFIKNSFYPACYMRQVTKREFAKFFCLDIQVLSLVFVCLVFFLVSFCFVLVFCLFLGFFLLGGVT